MPRKHPTAAELAFLAHAYSVEREIVERRNHRRGTDSRINEAALRAVIALHAVERAVKESQS